MRKTPWKGSTLQPGLLIKRAVPTGPWHHFPGNISPRSQKRAPCQWPRARVIVLWFQHQRCLPLELPGLKQQIPGLGLKGARASWESVLAGGRGSGGGGARREEPRTEGDGAEQGSYQPPCEQHSPALRLPRDRRGAALRTPSKDSLVRLARAIKNNMQVTGESSASRDPRSVSNSGD